MHALLTDAQQLLGANGGFVGRWDEERQLLIEFLNTITGAPPSKEIRLGEGATGQAAALRAPVIVNDYQRFEFALQKSLQMGVQAVIAAPLLHGGRLLGVVVIETDERGKQFTNADAELLVMLGGIAASTLVGLERKRAEERLRVETELLERLAETTSDAIDITDRTRRVLAWNRGAERLYGWNREDVLGQPLPCILPDRRELIEHLFQRVLEQGEIVANYQDLRLTKDGRSIPIMVTLSPMRDEYGAIVGLMGIAKDLSGLKALEEQQTILARMEERESIAMDLHDKTIQSLHGAVLMLAAAERLSDTDTVRLRAALTQLREQLTSTIRELRGYILDLRPRDAKPRDLHAALVELAEQVRVTAQLWTELDLCDAVEIHIRPPQVEQLLAVAREAVFNVVRHAQAHTLAIRLTKTDGRVVLAISDDGRGFDPRCSVLAGGQGLTNMSERVRLMGGRLTIASRPGTGAEIRAELPLGQGALQME